MVKLKYEPYQHRWDMGAVDNEFYDRLRAIPGITEFAMERDVENVPSLSGYYVPIVRGQSLTVIFAHDAAPAIQEVNNLIDEYRQRAITEAEKQRAAIPPPPPKVWRISETNAEYEATKDAIESVYNKARERNRLELDALRQFRNQQIIRTMQEYGVENEAVRLLKAGYTITRHNWDDGGGYWEINGQDVDDDDPVISAIDEAEELGLIESYDSQDASPWIEGYRLAQESV